MMNNVIFMEIKNVIAHRYKPYKKGKRYATYWFITVLKDDWEDLLNKAIWERNKLLYYWNVNGKCKCCGKRTSSKTTWKKI